MRKLIATLAATMMLLVALPAQAWVIEEMNVSGLACAYGQDVHYMVKAQRPVYRLWWSFSGSDFNAQGPWNRTSGSKTFNPSMPTGNIYDIDTGRQYIRQDANQNGIGAEATGWGGSSDVISLFAKYCGA